MKLSRYFFNTLIFVLLFLSCTQQENNISQLPDEEYEAYMKDAWNVVKLYQDSLYQGLQPKDKNPRIRFAPEFYEYYCKKTNTPTGDKALEYAFWMWASLGEYELQLKYLNKVPKECAVWPQLIWWMGAGYDKVGKREEFIIFLEKYNTRKLPADSKAMIFNLLGELYWVKGNYLKSENFFEKSVHLNADSSYTNKARNYLVDIRKFNIGKPAPTFSTIDLNKNVIDLEQLKGNNIFLFFWATWCGFCKDDLPHVINIAQKYKDSSLKVICISLDEDKSKLEAFLSEYKDVPWIQICDYKGYQSEIVKLYNTNSVPASFLLDKEGTIVAKNLRGIDIEKKITNLLSTL